MKHAAVSTLKATLSARLAKVKAGDEVLVVERGKPIAKLVPLSNDAHENESLRDLARAGLVRLGTGKLPAGFWKLPRPKDRHSRGLNALLEDRAEGDEVSGRVPSYPALSSGTGNLIAQETASHRLPKT